MNDFAKLDLIEPLRRAIAAQNYVKPTPIQAQAIPALLQGRDVLGCAQTGTGKTAAFTLPVLQHLAGQKAPRGKRPVRALILSPTRELAAQIGESIEAYAKHLNLRHLVMFGGVNEKPQIRALERGVDLLVACPGRLLDLHGRGFVDLTHVDFFVLDEADRMLDMGFVPDVRRILKALRGERQNLLFSATMPPSVAKLANTFMTDPVRIDITPESTTVEAIDQRVMFVEKSDKTQLLSELLVDLKVESTIVFTRTKHGANRLTKKLERAGFKAAAIHGNKSQNARRRALEGFQDGSITILVATDVASRGIDVESVTHVFNFDLPNEPESYVHRIGRTGRAGRAGTAIAFCDDSEGEYLRDIEKTIGESITVDTTHAFHSEKAMNAVPAARSAGGRGKSRGGRRRSSNRRSGGRKSRGGGSKNQNAPKQRQSTRSERSHGERKERVESASRGNDSRQARDDARQEQGEGTGRRSSSRRRGRRGGRGRSGQGERPAGARTSQREGNAEGSGASSEPRQGSGSGRQSSERRTSRGARQRANARNLQATSGSQPSGQRAKGAAADTSKQPRRTRRDRRPLSERD
ncbi:DEAD/DEAH box helicase [Lujinxingia litoralis]|uniref:DEAD/DEAH box helicase n=1 Tax=Lujinxingia litoralis TaxID=2211119 RepID=UPI0018F33B63|nr:DEAD/DEAH box helicase [Lujinxingia litoralis]